jgi:hypothetical protein
MDGGHVEPRRVGGNDDVVRLSCEVFPSLLLELQPGSFELCGVFVVSIVPRLDFFVSCFTHRDISRIVVSFALFQNPHLSRARFTTTATTVWLVRYVPDVSTLDGVEF